MAAVRRQIEVEAPPSVTEATWDHFISSVRNGHQRLACDELICVDAVKAGMISFTAVPGAKTRVEFSFEMDGNTTPSRQLLEQNMTRDLMTFKDYVERGGHEYGKPTASERREMQGREERSRHERHPDHAARGYEAASNKDMWPT